MEPNTPKLTRYFTRNKKVEILQEFEKNTSINDIATKFNCDVKRIKRIIQSKDEILKRKGIIRPHYSTTEQKIVLLNKVVYEFIQRSVQHGFELNKEIICKKALDIKCTILLDAKFVPSSFWLKTFMTEYEIGFELDLEKLKPLLMQDEVKENSIDTQDMIDYVRTHEKHNNNLNYKFDSKLEGRITAIEHLEEINKSKIDFLEACLYEYIQRAQFYKKTNHDMEMWLAKAKEFKNILQIEDFVPTPGWLELFRVTYHIYKNQKKLLLTRTPPASLDLRNIIEYCKHNKSTPISPYIKRKSVSKEKRNIIESNSGVKNKSKSKNLKKRTKLVNQEHEENQKNSATSSNKSNFPDAITVEDINNEFKYSEDEVSESNESSDDIAKMIKIEIEDVVINSSNEDNTIKLQQDIQINGEEFMLEINNVTDALRLLEPIEEFALLKENYRAIGLIGQLQDMYDKKEQSWKDIQCDSIPKKEILTMEVTNKDDALKLLHAIEDFVLLNEQHRATELIANLQNSFST